MSGSPALDIDQEIAKVTSLINVARRHLAEGKMIDLANLQKKIEELCHLAMGRPKTENQAIGAALGEIDANLDMLAEMLTQKHEEMMDELADGGVRKQAIDAYSKKPRD